jgi:lipoyl(octanoyl) transferase
MMPSDHTRVSTAAEPGGFILIDAGVSDYDAIYEAQKELVDKRRKSESGLDYLIFVEHPSVYTYGRKNRNPDEPFPPGVTAFAVERGGEATYHNEGQLVCYPIVKLEGKERDLHLHLRRLEDVIVDVLKDFSIRGERRPGATGVWIEGQQKKIASLGIAVSGWVTYHGSALNVNNDLSGFAQINPCGFKSEVMTSMQEILGSRCPSMTEVKDSFLTHFTQHFHRLLVV